MGSVIFKTTNDRLLNLDYSDPEIVKRLLSNFGELERLARKGDTVASAITIDLQNALGVNVVSLIRDKKRGFIKRQEAVLTEAQFIAISYVLILGYKQSEVAFILDCSVPTVNIHITRGLKRICKFLEGDQNEAGEEKGRGSGG